MGNLLSQYGWQQKKVEVMDHNNIPWLVDFDDLGGKSLIQALIVLPSPSLCSSVRWNMLFVVKERVELILSKAAPARLVLQEQISIRGCIYVII
jgi:hypothetical protein